MMDRNKKTRIVLDGVSFSYQGYKQKSLGYISANVDVGEEFWIVGPNSSGKTTLSYIIAGVIPTVIEGELTGSVVSIPDDGSPLPIVTSLLMQDSGVYLFATVRDEISYSLENRGVPLEQIAGKLHSLAEDVGIVGLLDRDMHTLSGGERQKVALAATLALEPDVLILDEPFEQLDPASASEVIALSRELARSGTTLIVATREALLTPSEARTLYLDGGRIVDRIVSKEYAPRQSHAQSSEALLEMDHVDYSYPKGPGIHGISFQVNSGRVLGLLGENGAGKSTIIKQTVGLLRPDSGVVRVCGFDTSNRTVQELSRSVGMLFQNPADQIFNADVISEVAWSLVARGMRKDAARESAGAVLEELGIAHLAGANPFEIPSSARQLVAFASILVTNPRLIVLDEPTKALDIKSAETVLGAIERRLAQGAGALIVTHDIAFIAHIADECALMSDGEIIGFGETSTILADEVLMRRARLLP